jgi:hypothetical protein
MSIEIIRRHEGSKSNKFIFGEPGNKPQISYNSDGRIVLRLIQNTGSDTLVILDDRASELLIDFCQNSLKNNHIREGAMSPGDDLPF